MPARSDFRLAIRKALAEDPRTIAQIAKVLGRPDKIRKCLYGLKYAGMVKYAVNADGDAEYSIDKWPLKAPPQRKENKPTASRSRTAISVPAAVGAAQNGASVFAINDIGQLALRKGDAGVVLEPDEFSRLRTFIERAESIFNPPE